MLQFQVASAIQEAIVREYSEYQESDVSVFAGWLVHYCIHHISFVDICDWANWSLQRYIRDAVLRAAAVAFKRLSLSLSFNVTPQILALVQNLAEQSSSTHSVRILFNVVNLRKSSTCRVLPSISTHLYPLERQSRQLSICHWNNISILKPNSIKRSFNPCG